MSASASYPRETPWGRADHGEKIATGIYLVGTMSHGGYWLSGDRMAQLPEWAAKANNFVDKAQRIGRNWWEEDCDWCVPTLAFQAEFRSHWQRRGATTAQIEHHLKDAELMLRHCHPDAFAAYMARGTVPA